MSKAKLKLLIVDDEKSVRDSLKHWFTEDGYEVITAPDGKKALELAGSQPLDIALLDMKMPGMSGLEVMERLQQISPDMLFIIMTAFADVHTAVDSLKKGAFDYITKPFDPDDLTHLIRNATRQRELSTENARLKEKMDIDRREEIIGQSPQMREIHEMIATVAQSDATVIIYGESGTGKELVARAIHNQSPRRYFPLISVNSGALPESLVESELFGHERGAFTGAQYRRKGKLELADGGTLFLDEIATISEKTQVDLLRVLETHEFTRLGGTKPIHSDFRVICATNRNLKHLVDEGKFREDLYYRLNVITIHLPPLRERQDDIPLLANYFLRKYAISMGKKIQSIEPDAMALLQSYQWPGNVRELENIMERALVVGSPPAVRVRDLHISCEKTGPLRIMRPLEEVEKEHIVAVLDETGWNISRSAVILGIDRATLYNKIRKFGLKQ